MPVELHAASAFSFLRASSSPEALAERAAELGGQWRHIYRQADGSDPQAALAELVARVRAEDRIRVHLASEDRRV